ncbi:hypothetical protein GQ53DRAFT_673583, partial [Thozetella sp. PMI_491]
TLEGHSGSVHSIAWSSDGRLASGSYDQTIKIWEPTIGQSTVVSMRIITSSNDLYHWPQPIGCGLNRDKTWVTQRGLNLIWLPSEYRPNVSATSGDNIAIGCRSGRVLLLGFLQHNPTLFS